MNISKISTVKENELVHLQPLASQSTEHILLSEEPCFRTIIYRSYIGTGASGYYVTDPDPNLAHVPIPYIHYLIQIHKDFKPYYYSIMSIWMSPRKITKQKFRRVSAPILTNMANRRPYYRPCMAQPYTTDLNQTIQNFWGGIFNRDYLRIEHPVVKELAPDLVEVPVNSELFTDFYQNWETKSIDDMLKMPWPQNILI